MGLCLGFHWRTGLGTSGAWTLGRERIDRRVRAPFVAAPPSVRIVDGPSVASGKPVEEIGKIASRLGSLGSILFQAGHDRVLEFRGDRFSGPNRRGQRDSIDMQLAQFGQRGGLENRGSRQEEITHRADGIQIAPSVDKIGGLDRLGGHIQRGPGHPFLVLGPLGIVDGSNQSKVQEFHKVWHTAASVEHDVCRLDVAMHETHRVGFEQRAAKLVEDFCDPAFGLRTISIDEVLEIDPIEVLHRIIKDSLRGPSVVIDCDGVWVVEIAGDLDFLFEAVDGCLIDPLDIQELDRTLPAQHRMMPSVDGSHRSFAKLDIEAILSELFCFHGRLPGFPLQTPDDDAEGQNRQGRQGQEPEHGVKSAAQNIQRLKGFVVVDLRDQTKRIILEPRPNADDRYASIVAVSSDIDPILLIHQLRR